MPRFGAVSSKLIQQTPGMILNAYYYLGEDNSHEVAAAERSLERAQKRLRTAKKIHAENVARADQLEKDGLLIRLDKEESCLTRKPKPKRRRRKSGGTKEPTGSAAS